MYIYVTFYPSKLGLMTDFSDLLSYSIGLNLLVVFYKLLRELSNFEIPMQNYILHTHIYVQIKR